MQTSPNDLEKSFLDALRTQYESRGFKFVARPTAEDVPDFLRGHQPDAIAWSKKENVVIEVKSRRSPEDRSRLSAIARLVEQHAGWRFRVYYGVPTKPQLYGRPSNIDLNAQLEEARTVFKSGHLRAALILGWGALEAAARAMSSDEEKTKAMLPRELLNWLEQEGHIPPETRHELRELVPIRNAIAHGSTEILVNKQHWYVLERVLAALLGKISGLQTRV